MAEKRRKRRIIFVQYTNPGAYPPLQHSSRILAEAGWEVWFVGAESFGSRLLHLPPHPSIRVTQIPRPRDNKAGPISYLRFCLLVLWIVIRWQPDWIYASEMLSSLPALVASLVARKRVIFHEHDSPVSLTGGLFYRTRRWLARRARLNVLPSEVRARAFREQTGAAAVEVVWNCPSTSEVAGPKDERQGLFVLHYHGNISPKLFPLSVVEALPSLPDNVVLRIVGYETAGNIGCGQKIMEAATALGVASRVTIMPPVSRWELLDICRDADVGLALFPEATSAADSYAGASNKVFDYMCSGLAVLITASTEWVGFLADQNCALSCEPSDPHSISAVILWFYNHRRDTQAMGESGRVRILQSWNYEAQFAPVWNLLKS